MYKGLMSTLCCLIAGGFLFAEPRRLVDNEDVAYIKSWMKDQRAQDLAHALNLTQDQLIRLRDIKQRVDEAKSEIEAERQAFQTEAETNAAKIRARLEASNQLSAEDRDLMRQMQRKRRELAETSRLKLRLASVGLGDLLDADQRAQVRDFVRQARRERGEQAADQAGERRRFGKRQGQRRGERGRAFGKRGRDGMPPQLSRILLSDAFMAYYSGGN